MVKLQDMPPQQRIVMVLVLAALVIFGAVGFFAPRGSFLEWKWEQFIAFTPGVLIGYALGIWVGSTSKNNKK